MEARHALAQLAIALEHYHFQHNSYDGATLETLHIARVFAQQQYQLNIEYSHAQDFLITATPRSQQARDDKICGVFTLNAQGIRGIRGTGQMTECW